MPPLAVVGLAVVIDGDTLQLHGQRIRLWGIDAPESRQWCEHEGATYPCGSEATAYLAALVAHKVTQCTERTRDRWQRVVAICTVDGVDLGAVMVEAGHAVAFVRYSRDYLPQQQRAQANRAGLWGGTFAMPWEWRVQHEPGQAR
jgi:endonuclease YncB( thermonuclease family)